MSVGVSEVLRDAAHACAELEFGEYAGPDALVLHRELVHARRAIQAAEARAAARVVETFAWRTSTDIADPADWLARASGCGLGEAQAALRTTARVTELPDTAAALSRGEISMAQADEITTTARAVPTSEHRMLDDAKRGVALKKLRENGAEIRHRAVAPEDLDADRRRRRRHRHWVDRHGMLCYSGALQPEIGRPIFTRVDTEVDRLYRAAQQAGDTETTRERRAADAFASVCATGGKPHATKRDVVIVAGINTVRTGTFVEGEPCHVLSPDGPQVVPPSVVRSYLEESDCFVRLVLHDGVQITHVKNVGRKQPIELRTALWLGDPPLFHGPECPCGCAKRRGLQIDHLIPVAAGGETSAANLGPKCTPSHREKSRQEREAGLYDKKESAESEMTERAPPVADTG